MKTLFFTQNHYKYRIIFKFYHLKSAKLSQNRDYLFLAHPSLKSDYYRHYYSFGCNDVGLELAEDFVGDID